MPVFLRLPDILTAANGLKSTFLISEKNTDFPICIPAVFIRTAPLKNNGDSGAAISGSTGMPRFLPICTKERILNLVKNKDYFVITTNVDHCFQRAGFDKNRLFYTQGDYGLFQDHDGEEPVTYDNEAVIRDMILSLGYEIDSDNNLIIPGRNKIRMEIPSELVPYDYSGKPMKMNLRADDTFVEDEGWHRAAERYMDFLKRHVSTKTVFLELGVGYNTPGIIKFPFWKLTSQWPDATYACLNYNEAYAPEEIIGRSIIISGDISDALDSL